MKITSFAVVLVLILLFIFVRNHIDLEDNRINMLLQTRYNRAIDTAAQDAAQALITNVSQPLESQYQSAKNVRINKEQAADTFFKTMYMNFNVTDDPTGQYVLNSYIPALVVVGYDGYYMYQFEEYRNTRGETEFHHVWSPKKPYVYKDAHNNTYSFTLDEYVTIQRAADERWIQGFRGEIAGEADIPLLKDAPAFDAARRTTIVNAIQNDLERSINQYNVTSKRYGTSYTFTVPYISQEDWNNTINDAGVLAFVQGIPLGSQYYNNYALGGARIVKKETFQGINVDGRKYYFSSKSCKSEYSPEEVFTSAKEAAQKGYILLRCGIGN